MAPFGFVKAVLLLWQVSESFSVFGGVLPAQTHVEYISGAILGENCTDFSKRLMSVAPEFCARYIKTNSPKEGILWDRSPDEATKEVNNFVDPEALLCFGLYDTHAELCAKNAALFKNATLSSLKFDAPKFCNTTKIAFQDYRNGSALSDKVGSAGAAIRNTWATQLRIKLSNETFCKHYCTLGLNVRDECSRIVGALVLANKTAAYAPATASGAPVREVQQIPPSPSIPKPVIDQKSSSIPMEPSDTKQKSVSNYPKIVEKLNIEEDAAHQSLKLPVQNQDPQPPLPAASTDLENKPVQDANKQADDAPPVGEGPEIGGEPEQSDQVLSEDRVPDEQNQPEGNDDQSFGVDAELPKQPKGLVQADQGLNDNSNTLVLMDKNNDDSNLMTNFLLMFGGAVLLCIAFCNKKKLLALALEGRRTHRRGDRHHSASYSKLHSNLEEAIVSGQTSPSTTHVLY